jgi:hypothetical protein
VLAAAALLTACQSSQTSASPQPTLAPAAPSAASRPTPAPCPAVNRPALRWPAAIPADVPKPPAAVLGEVKTAAGGLTLVRFTTASSLQESVLFVVKEVQKAGYTLGRGDAEPSEADAPFVRGNVRGIYRMLVKDTCSTEWLLAVTHASTQSNSPLLPRLSTASPTPLPFG